MSPLASTLFYVGAALMLLDAISYSLGAIRPIRAGVKAPNAYWDRRLLLCLPLSEHSWPGICLKRRNWYCCSVWWSVFIVA